MTSATHPLEIAEVRIPNAPGLLGISLCPGKHQEESIFGRRWQRDLEADIYVVRQWGASLCLTLTGLEEMKMLRVANLGEKMTRAGITWMQIPIRDLSSPDSKWDAQWKRLVSAQIHEYLEDGQKIFLHCKGGLGRAGTVAALLLIERGLTDVEAVRRVRNSRLRAVDCTSQELYLQRQYLMRGHK